MNLKEKLDRFLDQKYCQNFENDFTPLKLPPFPERRLRAIVGHPTLMLYTSVGQEFAVYLKLIAGLKPHHRVLDVGCGCGRIAGFLLQTIQSPGSYDGFDVHPDLISDAQKRITPLNPQFRFKHVDIYNQLYNPLPNAAKDFEFVFPYKDQSFDLVFLTSVFTHLLPQGLKQYVREIARVLKPGGKCLSTFFIEQNLPTSSDSWSISATKQNLKTLPNHPDSSAFRVANPNQPEDMICFDLNYIDTIFGEAKLKRLGEPYFGAWSGNPNFLSYQDILLFEKGS